MGESVPENRIELTPIGWVESPLTDRDSAPRQGHEGAPAAWLAFDPAVLEASKASGRAIGFSSSPGSIVRAAMCCKCIHAAI
jgi:hypothetical protein